MQHHPALLLVPLFLASPLAAQRSQAEVDSDIAFARGLAAEWQYVDLAEEVILDLERSGGLSKETTSQIGLVKCDIYAEGAKKEPDAELRNELYAKAVEAYRGYIDKNPFSEFLAQAERGYVDISNLYGKNLERRYQDAVGEEAEEIRNTITEVLEEALQHTGKLADGLKEEDWSVAQKVEWARVMYNRAQMLHTMGKTSEEGAFFFAQAESALEELSITVGEQTPQGLFAYLELAEVYRSMGQPEDAAAFAEFVVDTAVPIDPEVREEAQWDEFTAEDLAKRWVFVERGTSPLVEAYLAAGYPEDATKWALHFYNFLRAEGFALSPSGYLSLLAVARTLLDTGGFVGGSLTGGNLAWYETEESMKAEVSSRRDQRSSIDLALLIAQTVNAENRGNVLQIRAQKLISDVINRPGVVVSPDILFEAAQGEYFNKEYPAAIEAFKRVLRSLDVQDEATKQEYGAKVLYHVAESLRKTDRILEAAIAYKEGVTVWRGDPEYDEKNARGYYGTTGELKSKFPGAQLYVDMRTESEDLLTGISDNTEAIDFRRAKALYDQDEFVQARERFQKIPQSADNYEKAVAYAALCLYKLKDREGAEKEFADYVENFVTDTMNAVTTPKKVATRKEARAMAHYYLGRVAYDHVNMGKGSYEEVVKRLGTYHDEFPDQSSYGPNALYMVMMSHLALGAADEMKAVHDVMVEDYPTNKFTGSGALKIYNSFSAQRDKAQEANDEPRIAELTSEMAEYMRLSNQLAGSPAFGNMRAESNLWMELENWTEAERVLSAILKRFEGDSENDATIKLHVRPDLGTVLLAQNRAQDAYDVLKDLVPDPDDDEDERKPASGVVTNYCRAICGWVSEDADGNIVQLAGIGGEDNLRIAARYFGKLTQSVARDNKWECPWYEMKFYTAYAYYQWGLVNSEKMAAAKNQIETLKTELGTNLDGISESCGDSTLRKRFLWLWTKVQ